AAFVEYGGNRHGFLAFSEIHPDYYQIPVADRQALLAEEAQAEREAEKDEERAARRRQAKRSRKGDDAAVSTEPEADEGAAAAEGEATEASGEEEVIEHLGGADVGEEVPDRRHRPLRRQYKIQEVI